MSKMLPRNRGEILKQAFEMSPYPTLDDHKRLANQTGMTLAQVKNWFITRRYHATRKGELADSPKKPTRAYYRLTSLQRDHLKKVISVHGMYPDKSVLEELAGQLGFSLQKVRLWFTHERKKLKLNEIAPVMEAQPIDSTIISHDAVFANLASWLGVDKDDMCKWIADNRKTEDDSTESAAQLDLGSNPSQSGEPVTEEVIIDEKIQSSDEIDSVSEVNQDEKQCKTFDSPIQQEEMSTNSKKEPSLSLESDDDLNIGFNDNNDVSNQLFDDFLNDKNISLFGDDDNLFSMFNSADDEEFQMSSKEILGKDLVLHSTLIDSDFKMETPVETSGCRDLEPSTSNAPVSRSSSYDGSQLTSITVHQGQEVAIDNNVFAVDSVSQANNNSQSLLAKSKPCKLSQVSSLEDMLRGLLDTMEAQVCAPYEKIYKQLVEMKQELAEMRHIAEMRPAQKNYVNFWPQYPSFEMHFPLMGPPSTMLQTPTYYGFSQPSTSYYDPSYPTYQ